MESLELVKTTIRLEFKRENKTFMEGENREAALARDATYDIVDSYFPFWWQLGHLKFLLATSAGRHCQLEKAVYSTDLSEIRLLSHRVNLRSASDLSKSTLTSNPTPFSVDSVSCLVLSGGPTTLSSYVNTWSPLGTTCPA